jgi:diguanylate cyclase (GGDEF)-like protein
MLMVFIFAASLGLFLLDVIVGGEGAIAFCYMFGLLSLYRVQANKLYIPYSLYASGLIVATLAVGQFSNGFVFWAVLDRLLAIALLIVFAMALLENVRVTERLLTLSMTDPLTGILNRRYFLSQSAAELSRVRRYGFPLSVLMIDIDHFKSVNDRYGHSVGDQVIRTIAATCRTTLRLPDILARYGGEEFVITMPQTAEPEAFRVAERLRQQIEAAEIERKDENLRVTVSIGIAQWIAADGSIEDTIDRADKALYEAKRSGRNRVCVAPRVTAGKAD